MPVKRAGQSSFAAVALLAAWLTGAPVAVAADRAAAKEHLARAEQLRKQGKWAEACQHLEEVERLDPKLPTLIELAECSEQSGNLVAAQAQWAAARERAKRDEKPQSRAKAEARLAAVEKRLAHLTLQLAAGAAGAQVLRDDVTLDAASLGAAQAINPGDHVIVVKLAGHDDAKFPIKLADGDNQTLAITAGAAAAAPAASPALAPATTPPVALAGPAAPVAPSVAAAPAAKAELSAPTGWWSSERTAGVVVGGAGLLAVGAGTALVVVATGDKPAGSAVDARLTLGGISLATGGVLLISGLVLLATAPKDEPAKLAGFTLSPTLLVARDATVVGAVGAF